MRKDRHDKYGIRFGERVPRVSAPIAEVASTFLETRTLGKRQGVVLQTRAAARLQRRSLRTDVGEAAARGSNFWDVLSLSRLYRKPICAATDARWRCLPEALPEFACVHMPSTGAARNGALMDRRCQEIVHTRRSMCCGWRHSACLSSSTPSSWLVAMSLQSQRQRESSQ
jgi:hypothetical protein